MPADHFISDWEKPAIGTVSAFDLRLFTNATNPFVGASRSVTGFPGFPALKTAGIDILPAPEKRTEQRNLGSGRRTVCDNGTSLVQNGRPLSQRLRFATNRMFAHIHAAIMRQPGKAGESVLAKKRQRGRATDKDGGIFGFHQSSNYLRIWHQPHRGK